MKTYLLPTLVIAALAAAPAQAATYRITSATHTSTAKKTAAGYSGSVTTNWKLRKPARIAIQGGSGLATAKVRGATSVDITTDWPNGRCAWTAPTGDRTRTASAPESFDLMVTPGRVAFTGMRASLSNMYLGSECSTGVSGEPSTTLTNSKAVSARTFKKKTVTLKFAGSTGADGIAYSWATTIVLKRVKR